MAVIAGIPLLGKVVEPTLSTIEAVSASICFGVPTLVTCGVLFSRIWLGRLVGTIGGILTPFWLFAAIILLTEPFGFMFPYATHAEQASAVMANADKTHIATLGIAAMVGGVILAIIIRSLIKAPNGSRRAARY